MIRTIHSNQKGERKIEREYTDYYFLMIGVGDKVWAILGRGSRF
jgi:hypothetical protein